MTNFDAIYNEAKNDLELSIFNLRKQQLSEPGNRIKWLKTQSVLRKKVKTLKGNYTSFIESQYKDTKSNSALPKALIVDKIKQSTEAQEMVKQIEETEEALFFVQGVNKIFDGYNFAIKNAIEILKIESQITN